MMLRSVARLPQACPACFFPSPRRLLYSTGKAAASLAPAVDSTPSTSTLPILGVSPVASPLKPSPPKSRIPKARKAALSLSPTAVSQISSLLESPTPQLLRIGVRNKGCAGMSYHLEYVDKPDRFDEVIEQDGVKVVIDSKALFSIIGSRMDWEEGPLGAKFVFKSVSFTLRRPAELMSAPMLIIGCTLSQTRISKMLVDVESEYPYLAQLVFHRCKVTDV
ncbi:hypothetical protein P7C70_g1385, partial [Phenoliferia sp. Uapishka_3]